jgi:hypothetical protein
MARGYCERFKKAESKNWKETAKDRRTWLIRREPTQSCSAIWWWPYLLICFHGHTYIIYIYIYTYTVAGLKRLTGRDAPGLCLWASKSLCMIACPLFTNCVTDLQSEPWIALWNYRMHIA